MDVYQGTMANGTNIQQYSYRGGANQRWYIQYNGDNTCSILSGVNSNYALDIDNGSSSNLANVLLST